MSMKMIKNIPQTAETIKNSLNMIENKKRSLKEKGEKKNESEKRDNK